LPSNSASDISASASASGAFFSSLTRFFGGGEGAR
jgi:hypothetical protein